MKQILVVGGGDGGTIFANEIAKRLGKLIKKGEVSITVLDKKDMHPFQPANLYVAFKGHDYKKYQKPEKDLLRKEVKFVVDPAEKIDVAERQVITKSGKVYNYDYLIIATGSKTDYSEIPGLSEVNMDFHSDFESAAKIWKTLNTIKNGRLIFGVTDPTYKCPPSPMEGVLLADEFFRKRGIRDKVELTYISPLPRIYPIETINEIIAPIFEERNIEFIPFFNIDSVDSEKKKIYSMEGNELDFDYTILVPPHRGVDVVANSDIANSEGWVPVDKYFLNHSVYKEVYSIGDAADLPTAKTGVTAHLEALVASKNIANEILGISGKYKCMFTGRTNCPFEVGFGKATFVQTTYDKPAKKLKPTRLRYLMKKMFIKAFWMSLKGTLDFIFEIYFGKDMERCINLQDKQQ